MGISPSKRVKTILTNSNEFNSACDSAYAECLSLTQHAFQGVLPYQLPSASAHIHTALSTAHKYPLILKWVPSPPTRDQIDSAVRAVTTPKKDDPGHEHDEELVLEPAHFKEWALVLFAEAAVSNAEKAVLTRVPIGVAGIVGVGAVTKRGKELMGAASGVYALGVVISVWFSLFA